MAANQNVNAAPLTTDGRHPAKSVLKEAVDAVLNSFAKHTQGYGAGTPLAACLLVQMLACISNEYHSLSQLSNLSLL